MKFQAMAIGVAALLAAGAAQAEVKAMTPQGFEVVETATAKASPDKVFAAIVRVQDWWNSEHTYSGSAANLSIEPKPGGCFCEKLPGGGVEHLRVAFVKPGAILRLRGALGPLQGEGVDGALTFALVPDGAGGTKLSLSYIVGGYLRKGSEAWAPIVDQVLGEQFARLIRYSETGKP
ncbi:MAG: ATPase [Pseudomonadota bacterium]|jgi:hypothetical protein